MNPIESSEVAVILKDAFQFLESKHGFRIKSHYTYGIGCGIQYRRGSTEINVTWDLRENMLGADFSPIDPATRRPSLSTSVSIMDLVAINGGRAKERVDEPHEVTVDGATHAARQLALLVQKYGGSLLEDEWNDVVQRVRDWHASGAWRQWRDS